MALPFPEWSSPLTLPPFVRHFRNQNHAASRPTMESNAGPRKHFQKIYKREINLIPIKLELTKN
jgi:hypothetical protein